MKHLILFQINRRIYTVAPSLGDLVQWCRENVDEVESIEVISDNVGVVCP